MPSKALFVAVLEDNTVYIGGKSYEKTLWLELSKEKKIKRLFYSLPDGNHLCLDLYDRYFLMQEAVCDLQGNLKGQTRLEYSYIMGEKDNKVTCYKINLKENDKIGNIERKQYATTDPFIMGLSKDGWR
jgi:hypothetical protein